MLVQLPVYAQFTLYSLIFFAIIVGRYFLVAGLFDLYFNHWKKEKWSERRLHSRPVNKSQFRKEVKWSMVTAVIFAIAGSLCMMAWERGYTRLYTGNEYPLWWTILSPILVIFIQESYYYWIHRWMHIPSVFRKVHRVHHDSHITSPWTAFSFHPLEGFLQALIIPLLIIIIPIHLYALLFLLVFMSVTSVINHLDIEIYPSWMIRSRIGRMMIGATHHSLHHKQYKYNFGLYFTFWDRWLKTESPLFGKTSAETDKKKVLQQPLQDPG